MGSSRRLAVSVGALLIVSAILGVAIVMFIGRQRLLFSDKITYRAGFPDVAGLRQGAVVRLGGRNVGVVKDITFEKEPTPRGALTVTFKIRKENAGLVRQDSRALVSSQGLLGDKLLEVTIGSEDAPPVEDGGWLIGVPPSDPAKVISAANDAAEDVRDAVADIRKVVDRVDKELVAQASDTLRSIGDAADRVGRTAGELQDTVRSVDRRTLNDAIQDLADTAADLSAVASNVAAGRGSLGGFMVDPTLYEEAKRSLVNLRRNRILTTLARLVISKEEPAAIKDANPASVVVHPRPGPEPTAPPARTRPPRKSAKAKHDTVIR